jgi:UDP-N-acetylglucosamine--N-acetylmuramyl-(pentapeptide) pyrophosphoryl-undecaprenol N-acetylglucosamine transferase
VLEKIGAAKIILNKDLTAKKLSEEIDDIILNKSELVEMGKLAETIAPKDVEENIYKELKQIIRGEK